MEKKISPIVGSTIDTEKGRQESFLNGIILEAQFKRLGWTLSGETIK